MRISFTITVLFTLLAAVLSTAPTHAQRVQRIAAIVNDDIVSVYDLQARMQIVISSTGLKPTPKFQRRLARQILRRLVDERLQLQEAKRRNVSVSRRNMARAIANIEKQNQIPRGGFDKFVARNGIAKEAALAQIRAQIAWSKLVRRVLSPRVTVGDDEIEERLNRLKSRRGETEYHLLEILLTIDSPQAKAEILRTAERLADGLRKGTDFQAIARQFSRGASASVGGDLGWIAESSLESE
jgi:peptidyl-prolyl cis-trans isomerase SurA